MAKTVDKKAFEILAYDYYNNPQCVSDEEYKKDLGRFDSLKRLFCRYVKTKELRSRLILNHLTVIINLFGIERGVELILMKMKQEHYPYVKTFLEFMGHMSIHGFDGINIDDNIKSALKKTEILC